MNGDLPVQDIVGERNHARMFHTNYVIEVPATLELLLDDIVA